MKNAIIRMVTAVLAVMMLLSVLASCTSDNDNTTIAETTTKANEAVNSVKEYKADIPEGTKYTDTVFTVYAYPEDVFVWSDSDWQNEGIMGDTINDAVYTRTMRVESLLDIEINVFNTEKYTNCNDLVTSIKSGDNTYSLANINMLLSFQMAQNGYIAELNSYGCLDLDADWWDQNCIKDLSIHNMNFALTGDIITMYKRSIGTILFNKDMIRENTELTNPYDLVKSDKWTLDNMISMAQAVSTDDGDGIWDTNDTYGLVFFSTMACMLPIGCGVQYAEKNTADEPVLSFSNEKMNDILNRSSKLLYNKTLSYNINPNGFDESTMQKMFMADQALFYYGELHSAEDMRAMSSDFGILTLPMYNEEQDGYHHSVNPNVAATIVIPSTNTEQEMTSYVLDALGAESKNILTPAYYSKNLQGVVSRDVESTMCLDIIIGTLRYDIGLLAVRKTGDLMRSLCTSYSTNIASEYSENQSVMELAVKNLIEKIDANYKDNG